MVHSGRPVASDSPHLAEADLGSLDQLAMAPEQHFVRTHGITPSLDAQSWRLVVDGAVKTPLSLDLAELRRRPRHSVLAVMECAGNGRRYFTDPVDGDPWGDGAASCSQWSGIRLADLLAEAHPAGDAVDVVCVGASSEADADFARGLPLAVALAPETLVAFEHGGRPLLPEHGAPLRLVVPTWYGVAWVKWLHRLTVSTTPYRGYWNTERYVLRKPGRADEPLGVLRCKSVITAPRAGSTAAAGPLRVAGLAWSGAGPVSAVEVSTDAGRTWQPAEITESAGSMGWVRWRAVLELPPGQHAVRSRATDSAGRVQPAPEQVKWNAFGYGYDGSVDVGFTLR